MLVVHHLVLLAQLFIEQIYSLIFADGNVLHFRSNDPFFCIVHLRYIGTLYRTVRFIEVRKAQHIQFGISQALLPVIRRDPFQLLHILPAGDPLFP
ncbi:hypothetical protein D3C87_1892380 [compost metagenome]